MWNKLQTAMIWSDDQIDISPLGLVNEASVQFELSGRLLPTYNNTMFVLRGKGNYLSLNSGGTAHHLQERFIPDLALLNAVNDRNRIPGDLKFSIKWRAAWARLQGGLAIKNNRDRIREWRAVIAQVHGYMWANNMRVGYVMSDIEMQTAYPPFPENADGGGGGGGGNAGPPPPLNPPEDNGSPGPFPPLSPSEDDGGPDGSASDGEPAPNDSEEETLGENMLSGSPYEYSSDEDSDPNNPQPKRRHKP
ncbi:hypothetical protein EWM64_g10268 [Hericium alpestre]|uniref:Uncharacterized protein n=1 Tax=Hericium alpestre TaxID=135208 RepID=A0A4Y9ZIP7_9AGAM|nr:hypothetical protein EWM64_g10268 [Hericium alpestre]